MKLAVPLLAALVATSLLMLPAAAQPYADRSAFDETEVIVGGPPWALPGTLTVPRGPGPFAAVVLIHGSGPNDRDTTIGPNKPFRDLAWGLATRGIAVLRYDKRTRVYPIEVQRIAGLTVDHETVADALAAIAVLRRTPRIDSAHVFVAGHSLGGMLAPRIGVRDRGIAGFVLAAAPARPLEDLAVEQVEYLVNLDGVVSARESAVLAEVRRQAARIKDPALTPDTPASELLGAPGSYWLDLRRYDPVQAARDLRRPLLILQGERDYQVTTRDFTLWRQTLAGNADVTFVLYPRLNHLFMEGRGPGTPAEYERPGHVTEEVIIDIAAWVRTR